MTTIPPFAPETWRLLGTIAWWTAAAVGLVVVALAAYGYRRNRSRPMLFLALGIASFTVVDFVATVLAAWLVGPVVLPLVGNGVELVGMVSILYAVVLARRE
ncbi:DUF7521 family protein [Halobaculum litoreum]|uniref:DUF7521 family protein n=1 Tax=Halobaculum litoreum TaxID=3031998 RepID=UPI0024C4590C|nr:hypothetical protein [Halobaculum sp. DT92]